MWNSIVDFFSNTTLGIAFAFAIVVVIAICCMKVINWMGQEVMPKRVQNEIKRERCAGIIANAVSTKVKVWGWTMLKNVRFAENAMADVLLIGPFGVLALVGCNVRGQLYPVDESSEKMTGYYTGKKMSFDNVMAERLRVEKAVNEVLREAGIRRCRGEAYAVFTNRRSEVVAPESMKFTRIADMNKFFRKDWFAGETVEVDKVVPLFEGKVEK